VPFIENAFIINLGDLMPRWTCNIWKATPHRVIGKEEELKRGRMTIPFFGLVNSNTLLEAIPSCLEKQKQQQLRPESTFIYQPILAGNFFSEHEKYSIYHRG
jgi:isopenicillin N synthase-like dioxygenase